MNDIKEGIGEMRYNNGDKYNGNWIDDNIGNGEGNMIYKNGNEYIGNWINEMKNENLLLQKDIMKVNGIIMN